MSNEKKNTNASQDVEVLHKISQIVITILSKILSKNLVFHSIFILALLVLFTTKQLLISSKSYTKKVSLSKKKANNITTKKLNNSQQTVILLVNVLTVTQMAHTATNAKNVVHHFLHQILSTLNLLLAVANLCLNLQNTGIYHQTNTRHGYVSGFLKTTKNGVQTCMVNAKVGQTWVFNHVL